MNRPSSVRIAGIDYPVEFLPEDHPLDTRLAGRINYGNPSIHILDRAEPVNRRVLLHEILHACSEAGDLGLSEEQVVRLEHQLFAVLSDNPVVASYIAGLGV